MKMVSIKSRIEKAVSEKIAPAEIEAYIGMPSLVNTLRERDRRVLNMVDILSDKRYQTTLPDLKQAKDVAYWNVGETDDYVEVLGICWLDSQKSIVFGGLIGPP